MPQALASDLGKQRAGRGHADAKAIRGCGILYPLHPRANALGFFHNIAQTMCTMPPTNAFSLHAHYMMAPPFAILPRRPASSEPREERWPRIVHRGGAAARTAGRTTP